VCLPRRACPFLDYPPLPASAGSVQQQGEPLEKIVSQVWARVLACPLEVVLPYDSFVALGGESLLALRACATLRYELSGEGCLEEQDAPQFGEIEGAFAVVSLLAASSLEAYCEHLRSHGYARGKARGSVCKDETQQAVASASAQSTWPEVRRAAQQTGPGAVAGLISALDSLGPRDQMLCLAGAGCRKNVGGRFTALHAAAQADAVECLQLLLERRARATVTEGGAAMTPAHYAAMYSPDCLRLLLAAGSPLPVRDARGQSLIHAAARAGNAASLAILVDAIDHGRNSGLRSLRSGEGNRSLLQWTDRWARSAVHWAVLNGHADALAVLLRSGASPSPPLITGHQMAKRTHLTQEQPLDLALRVHGAESDVAVLLQQALLATNEESKKPAGTEVSALAEAENVEDREQEISKGAAETGTSQYLLTLGSESGLDKFAVWEVGERLAATRVKRTQCRIFFESCACPAAFLSLKSPEKICAVLLRSTAGGSVDFDLVTQQAAAVVGSDATPEASVAEWIASLQGWPRLIALWWQFVGRGDEQSPLTFKVTCRRNGKRFAHLSSQRLAVSLASALERVHSWKPQVRCPDFEVRLLLNDAEVLVDVPLLVQPAVPTGGGQLVEAGLAAPVAWALARSAELKPGERVLDPMCGKGVILIEAALSWPSCKYLGSDLDEEQLSGARRNAQLHMAGAVGACTIDLCRSDARRLPVPSGSVDALICDIPFGKQYSTVEECRNGLYKDLLLEFDRVVCPVKGRAVLLSSIEQEAWVLYAAGLRALPEGEGTTCKTDVGEPKWICVARRELKLGFLEAIILVLHRPTVETRCQKLPDRGGRLWWEGSGGRGEWATLKVRGRPVMRPARGRAI